MREEYFMTANNCKLKCLFSAVIPSTAMVVYAEIRAKFVSTVFIFYLVHPFFWFVFLPLFRLFQSHFLTFFPLFLFLSFCLYVAEYSTQGPVSYCFLCVMNRLKKPVPDPFGL